MYFLNHPPNLSAPFRFIQRTQLQPKDHQSRRSGCGLRYRRRTRLLAREKQVNLSPLAANFSLIYDLTYMFKQSVSVIPVGELRGEKKASFEWPETRRISAASPALQSILRCENRTHPLIHRGRSYYLRYFIYLFNIRDQMFVVSTLVTKRQMLSCKSKILSSQQCFKS